MDLKASSVNDADNPTKRRTNHQPINIKKYLEQEASMKKLATARRMTSGLHNANSRRQLYAESSGKFSPEGQSNAQVAAHLPGLSKSEGKIKEAIGRERCQPVKIKDIMASWEKSQTVKPVRKQSTTISGGKSVRRKLYSLIPATSPAASTRKSIAVSKPAAPNPEKFVKPETVKKGKPIRKSSLLPPKSIRDRLTSQRNPVSSTVASRKLSEISENVNSSIVELPVTPEPKGNPSIILSSELAEKLEKCMEDVKEFLKTKEKSQTSTDCQRPTVIMSTVSTRKNTRATSVSSTESDSSTFAISRPPLQELHRNLLFAAKKLDAPGNSIEDLLGNSRIFEKPSNVQNFAESILKKSSKLDLQWLRGNVILSIQSMEESLFSMRSILKAVDDIIGSEKTTEKSPKVDGFENFPPEVPMSAVAEVVPSSVPEVAMSSVPKVATSSVPEVATSFEPEVATSSVPEVATSSVPKVATSSVPKVATSFVPEIATSSVPESATSFVPEVATSGVPYMATNLVPEVAKLEIKVPEMTFTEKNLEMLSDEARSDDDKENEIVDQKKKMTSSPARRRRSLRLAKLAKSSDDSFSRLENELCITIAKKSKSKPGTPVERKKLDPRSRRSIREYMALKSTVNFLQTPDVKGLPTPMKMGKDTPSRCLAEKRSISRKLLTELDDLYSESPH